MLTFLSPTTSTLTVLSICAKPKTQTTENIKPFSCCHSFFSILSLFESVLTLVKAAYFTHLSTTILKSSGNLNHISPYPVNQSQPIMCHLAEHVTSSKQRKKNKTNKNPRNNESSLQDVGGKWQIFQLLPSYK